MKRAFTGVLLAAALAGTAAAEELRLAARQSTTLSYPGVLAAFAVDAATVETTVADGQVLLHARRAGQTFVTVVLPDGIRTLSVQVEPPAPRVRAMDLVTEARASWEGRYDSGLRRFSTTLAARWEGEQQSARLRLEALHERRGTAGGLTALPAATLELERPGRSLVLLDALVHGSPLTLDGTGLRGLHWREDGWQLHAGLTTPNPYDDLLLPRNGERVAAWATTISAGGWQLRPAALWLPDSGGRAPGVLALGLRRGGDSDPLQWSAELGWGGRPAAAVDLQWRKQQRQAWLHAAVRPAGFATLRSAAPPGVRLEGAWTERLDSGGSATLSASANRLELMPQRPQATSLRLDLRQPLAAGWSLSGALGTGSYRSQDAEPLRRASLSWGANYERTGFGLTALHRYERNSAASQGGHGGRLSLRTSGGGWRANLFLDAQQQAPTLELILQDRPDLARAVTELGIGAGSPEDVLRQLRDNAGLLATRGVTLGSLRLDPLRLQAGLDVSWRAAGSGGPELGLRLLGEDVRGVAAGRRNLIGTLYAHWRLGPATQLTASYSHWSQRRSQPGSDLARGSFEFALRHWFNDLQWPGTGGGAITGRVVREDLPADAEQGLAGVEVVLDHGRRTRTDAQGRFRFDAPGPGSHRLEAILPAHPGAYFTAPAIKTVPAGGAAEFAVTFSAARLGGVVRNDAGLPLAGVKVRLEGTRSLSTSTDSSGHFRLATPAGSGWVRLLPESLPPGYELAGLAPQAVELAAGQPQAVEFRVRAQRSIQGVVKGAGHAPITISVMPGGREVSTDAAGRFLLRGLPAGPVQLRVRSPRGETQRQVELPAEPTQLKDVVLAAP